MHKAKSGISRVLANMTVLPLILFGVVTMLIGSYAVRTSINHEVRHELQRLAQSAIVSMDTMYPGEYGKYGSSDALLITKGDTILNENHAFLDSLKEATDVDYTFFYGSIRVNTTLYDNGGMRLTGSYANEQIIADVLDTGNSAFYDKVDVFKESYFAYYEPIKNSKGECVGMLATAMPTQRVRALTIQAIIPILLLTLVFAFLAELWSYHFSKQFIQIIQKLKDAFDKSAKGQLMNTVPTELLARKDEIGDMSHALVDMQKELRSLVEQDMLTGLNNRRFGQQKLHNLVQQTKGTNKHFSIALGDIDFFKKFNDTHGHDCGDAVLRDVSASLKSITKDHGYAIRWGGEEFLIVLTTGSYAEHITIMESVIEHFRNSTMHYDGKDLSITMTFGLIDTTSYDDIDAMLIAVDKLLYQGKENGRNQLVYETK